jgi:hypothetical protein
VDAHGSELGFVECTSLSMREACTAREVSDEIETIRTDELVIGRRELTEWEFIVAWDCAVCGRSGQEWLVGPRSHVLVSAGSRS